MIPQRGYAATKSRLLAQRRKGAKKTFEIQIQDPHGVRDNARCHFDRREKSFLSTQLGVLGVLARVNLYD
jgi:hypothetical protein